MAVNPVFNITIPQGADFSETFVSTETDGSTSNLVGYTGSASIKKHAGATTSTSFSVSIISSTAEVSIAMTSGKTVSLKPGRYVYDLVIETGGTKTRAVEGTVLVRGGVTR